LGHLDRSENNGGQSRKKDIGKDQAEPYQSTEDLKDAAVSIMLGEMTVRGFLGVAIRNALMR